MATTCRRNFSSSSTRSLQTRRSPQPTRHARAPNTVPETWQNALEAQPSRLGSTCAVCAPERTLPPARPERREQKTEGARCLLHVIALLLDPAHGLMFCSECITHLGLHGRLQARISGDSVRAFRLLHRGGDAQPQPGSPRADPRLLCSTAQRSGDGRRRASQPTRRRVPQPAGGARGR